MSTIEVVFTVPKWIEAGVRSGSLQIFGGVVRDNAGRIVYMLREGVRVAPRYARGRVALVVIAVAAVSGLGYLIYRKWSTKGHTFEQMDRLEKSLLAYSEAASARSLATSDIRAMAREFEQFAAFLDSDAFRNARVEIPTDAYDRLFEFYRSVQDFNARLQTSMELPSQPPSQLEDGSLQRLCESLHRELLYQERLYEPAAIRR